MFIDNYLPTMLCNKDTNEKVRRNIQQQFTYLTY